MLDQGVGLGTGGAGELGGDGGGPAGGQLFGEQVDGPAQKGRVDARGGAGGACDHDRDLSASEVVFVYGLSASSASVPR